MRVIIAGSRSITDYDFVCRVIEESCFDVTEVVSGTARGVDQLGERWAKDNGIPVAHFPADWDKYGKSAGYVRNTDMGDYADALIAVWDGESRGTNHMVDIMSRLGKFIYVRKPSKWEREWK
jgi:hypothetical protein